MYAVSSYKWTATRQKHTRTHTQLTTRLSDWQQRETLCWGRSAFTRPVGPQVKNTRFQEISKDWSLKKNAKLGRPSGSQFQGESLYYTFVKKSQEKMSTSLNITETQIKSKQGFTAHQSEGPLSKALQTFHPEEGVMKREPSSTDAGSTHREHPLLRMGCRPLKQGKQE